jgi:hypothetical protein
LHPSAVTITSLTTLSIIRSGWSATQTHRDHGQAVSEPLLDGFARFPPDLQKIEALGRR